MLAIVGSGFGLYGYLPAAAGRFGSIVLPQAYRAKVEARAELEPFRAAIHWAADESAALALASGVVIAVPPQRQVEVATRCLALDNIRVLLLEKPLAPTPAAAVALLAALRGAGKRHRIAYTLEHAGWAQGLAWPTAATKITWTFMAHHFRQDLRNWKRLPEEGGGALRFFGVHVIAFLARRGYLNIEGSRVEGEAERWSATFTGPGLPRCEVLVDSRAHTNTFRIDADGPLVALDDPFGDEAPVAGNDRRVAVLARHLDSLDAPDAGYDAWYAETNRLWQLAEQGASA